MKKIIISIIAFVFSLNANSQYFDCDKEIMKLETNDNIIYMSNFYNGLSISKYFSKKDSSINYLINITITSNSLFENANGVYFLLENGQSLRKDNNKITIKPNQNKTFGDGKYLYNSIVFLEFEEIMLLSTFEISVYKLYVFENDIDPQNRKNIKQTAYCLLTTK
ncbi:MAG: hypothetical protein LCH67_06170 [Bacteroidetes bacterium]|nr:hypothetical protein [Bacteroidota bacterium]